MQTRKSILNIRIMIWKVGEIVKVSVKENLRKQDFSYDGNHLDCLTNIVRKMEIL
jgi:hypothetical protein